MTLSVMRSIGGITSRRRRICRLCRWRLSRVDAGPSADVVSFVFARVVSFGFASATSFTPALPPLVRVAVRRLGAAASFAAGERVRLDLGAGASSAAPPVSSPGSSVEAAVAAVLPRPRPPRRRPRLAVVVPSAPVSSARSAAASDGADRSAGSRSVSDRTSPSRDASGASVVARVRPLPPRPRPPLRRRRRAPVAAEALSGVLPSSIVAGMRSVSPGWLSRSTSGSPVSGSPVSGSLVPADRVRPSGVRVRPDEPPRPPRPRPPRERRRRVGVPVSPVVSFVAPDVADAPSGSDDTFTPIPSGGDSVMLTPFDSVEEARASRERSTGSSTPGGDMRERESHRRLLSRCAGVRRRSRRPAPAALHCARGKPALAGQPTAARRDVSPGPAGPWPRLLEPRRACSRPRWPRVRRENLLSG
jgi:hypothetical protein